MKIRKAEKVDDEKDLENVRVLSKRQMGGVESLIFELARYAEAEGEISAEEREAVTTFVANAIALKMDMDDLNKRGLIKTD
jgi:hypothetical protein